MADKTLDGFLDAVRNDDNFRGMVEHMPAEELAMWLRRELGPKLDVSRLSTGLWVAFPHKPFAEILEVIAALNAMR